MSTIDPVSRRAVLIGGASGFAATVHSAARDRREASGWEMAAGAGLGGFFGWLTPWAAYGGGIGGTLGYYGGELTGQWDPSTGFVWG